MVYALTHAHFLWVVEVCTKYSKTSLNYHPDIKVDHLLIKTTYSESSVLGLL